MKLKLACLFLVSLFNNSLVDPFTYIGIHTHSNLLSVFNIQSTYQA